MAADELMTTRELQDFLRVDRTTIYNMLNAGRLPGFKVGGQWRFSRREIESWMREQREVERTMPLPPSPNVFPLDCIHSIQSIFSEAIDVGSIVTRLDGQPLTEISNSCAFCDLILSTPEGSRRCAESWQALTGQIERKPRLRQCHAGLLYARGRIEVENEFLAMVFAGQIVVNETLETVTAGVGELAAACALDPAQLRDALPSVRFLTADRSELLMNLLERMAKTLSDIGRERLVLLRKLRHIAEVTSL
ncbi:MAG TPA: helix-turn-helix domain-containing protein [Thermoflexia bacterium]|nr:helix-turn-helix domain-containing protein [Thermoflexia bacterium]